ncbi:hypothetical protein BDN70DRAFT_893827 [Pholiota conissans]|uniref:Uncharacterized protein n=1 Tax=Pholiota conissans TaxID=109636 RepID=A0A9P5Z3T4_9AGAR|nr:hypothetical protein BDN70DRAFT_893827 [Pholiota conissans]
MFARSFTLLVSLFCATASLASPVPSAAGLVLPTGLTSLAAPSLPFPTPGAGVVPRAQVTLPQLVQNLVTNVTPCIDHLKLAVEDQVNVDVELVKTSLNSVVVVLGATVSDLKAFLAGPIEYVEETASVQGIVGLLGPVLSALFTVLVLVAKFIATSPVGTTLAVLVGTITSLVGQIVLLLLQIAPVLLAPILSIVAGLPLKEVLAIVTV